MKLAPIIRELKKHRLKFTHKIVHTGQHYDYNLSKIFFKDLELPSPDIYLGAGSASHAVQTGIIMHEFEKVVLKEKPDMVLVFGDVNSTLACAIVCAKAHHGISTLPLAHVESGLRSFDRTMPEEINRVVTDSLSKFLFVTEKTGVDNLLREGVQKKKIFLVGDTMIDSLVHYKNKFESSDVLKKLNLIKQKYILTTIHRPVNVDEKANLAKIISIFKTVSMESKTFDDNVKIVFPVHPRTLNMIAEFGMQKSFNSTKNLIITKPLGYSDFIKLLMYCKLVVTDSGGIQEEATFLNVPCLTLRDSFERPETITLGTNTLCGLNEKLIRSKVNVIFSGKYKKGKIPKLMDGKASERIVKVLVNSLSGSNIC